MQIKNKSQSGVEFSYQESFMTGKKTLTVNGKEAKKLDKKRFSAESPSGELIEYTVKGNFLSGVSVISSTGETTVIAKNTWYDWVMICLPLVGIIFGVLFCGAIGGGLSALCCLLAAVFNAQIARTQIHVAGKFFAQLGVAVVANGVWFGLWYVIAVLILALI